MAVNLLDDEILITDEAGLDHVMKILFTYENEERGKTYAFLYEKDDEENIVAFSLNEKDQSLEEILDDEEYKEVEEVFNAYIEDPKIQEAKK